MLQILSKGVYTYIHCERRGAREREKRRKKNKREREVGRQTARQTEREAAESIRNNLMTLHVCQGKRAAYIRENG